MVGILDCAVITKMACISEKNYKSVYVMSIAVSGAVLLIVPSVQRTMWVRVVLQLNVI